MIHVDHYGLHKIDGDIALLVQQGRVDHVLGVNVDYKVSVRTRRPCTHSIDLEAARAHEALNWLEDDPLFRAMLPVPKDASEKPLFLEDSVENRLLVQRLGCLSSPGSFSVLLPFWAVRPDVARSFLQETNVQPLVLYGPRHEDARALHRILDAGLHTPRRLIVMADRYTVVGAKAERIEPTLQVADLATLDLEALGAWVLREHMLGN